LDSVGHYDHGLIQVRGGGRPAQQRAVDRFCLDVILHGLVHEGVLVLHAAPGGAIHRNAAGTIWRGRRQMEEIEQDNLRALLARDAPARAPRLGPMRMR
ncbi:MAG: hypothetical protein ABSH34_31045, partial [Verrucomicrobiota bacterium]